MGPRVDAPLHRRVLAGVLVALTKLAETETDLRCLAAAPRFRPADTLPETDQAAPRTAVPRAARARFGRVDVGIQPGPKEGRGPRSPVLASRTPGGNPPEPCRSLSARSIVSRMSSPASPGALPHWHGLPLPQPRSSRGLSLGALSGRSWQSIAALSFVLLVGCPATTDDDDSIPACEDLPGYVLESDCGDDADCDGLPECGGDCDDTDPTTRPGAAEQCDWLDHDPYLPT